MKVARLIRKLIPNASEAEMVGFDEAYYRELYRDTAQFAGTPLQHYLQHGWKEGRDPSASFSTNGYLAANPDVAASGLNPLLHFSKLGMLEGRKGWEKTESAPIDTSYRITKLTYSVNRNTHKGLEIGALNRPTISPATGIMEYVDYTNTEGLRDQHKDLPERVAGIVDVHHVWAGSGSLLEVIGGAPRYDFAIASHVIEHVPNTLDWFRGIMEALKPGGHFNLAIPDMRYTFDVKCPVSTIGQLIEADLCSFLIPSIRQMVDHCVHITAIEPGQIWTQKYSLDDLRPYNGEHALWLAEAQAKEIVQHGRYFDSHCWIYTPESFLGLIRQASLLGRFGYEIVSFDSTLAGDHEFFISLRRPDTQLDSDELKRRQCQAIDDYLQRISENKRIAALAAR